MQRHLFTLITLFALPVFAAVAVDEEATVSTPVYRHELVLGVNPLAGFAGRTTGGDIYLDFDQSTFFSVAATYNIAIIRWLQFGVNTGVSHLSVGMADSTFFQLLGGPTLNIPLSDRWLAHSLFLATHAGVLLTNTNVGGTSLVTGTEFVLTGELGYRLPLSEDFNWNPSVGVYKVMNGSNFLFFARPISFGSIF